MTGPNTSKKLTTLVLLLATPLARAQNVLSDPGAPWDGGIGMLALPLMVIALVAIAFFFKNAREKRRHDLYIRFLEKGQEIPRELMPRLPSRRGELIRGVWLLSLGLGIGIVLLVVSSEWRVAVWSVILLFLAAASFVNAALFYPRGDSDRRAGDPD